MEPYRERVLQEMRRRASAAQHFVAPNAYYAGHMRELLRLPRESLTVVPLGIRASLIQDPAPHPQEGPVIIGYLARICPEKGLHLLAEAFRDLCHERRDLDLRLHVAGYLGLENRSFLQVIKSQMESWGLSHRFAHLGELDGEEKRRFLTSIQILALPTTYREAKGIPMLEALAAGVPVVVPEHGSFPELVNATGGGVLVEPGSPNGIKEALERLVDNPELRQDLGSRGQKAIQESFTDSVMARGMAQVYDRVLKEERGAAHGPGQGPG
jgi:glycosyltransferase involved in cell wall biosynthesis